MGGHGGLNILPQKRWNVYGQRNRLKVHEDETKHAEEQREQHQKKEKAEREFRIDLLRKRARPNGAANQVEHINLFEEEERNQEHLEVKKEREVEDRKRGRKSDRTSDARFDERFAFAHKLSDSKPWYTRPAMRFNTETPEPPKEDRKSRPATDDAPVNKTEKKRSKKDKKKKKAKELLKELKKSNFKKAEIDVALLRIERLRREKSEKSRVRGLSHALS